MDGTIANWSPGELRRFIINNVLTDPGVFPKEQTPTPATELSYIRVQGALAGFIADLNFRIYNLSSPSIILEHDPDNHFSLSGGALSVRPGNYVLGFYVDGPASGYEAGWTLTYNGATIDYTISNGINYGGLGAVQNMGCSASGMTNFFAQEGGTIQISGFQNAAIQVAGMWAMYLPS